MFNASVAGWNKIFKMISIWAFGPLALILIAVFIFRGFNTELIVRFLLCYVTAALAFYGGHFTAYKSDNDVLGWFIGVTIFVGLCAFFAMKLSHWGLF